MARLKAPLLGMDASGPLGRDLTFSHVKGLAIAKRSPWHPDAKTLPQLYQRWRYYDAVQYWHSLTAVQQAAYHVLGRPYHQTGYQHLISLYLQNPLDQVLWLRLDTADPITAPDFSKKDNEGTLFGPSLVSGKIDHCRSFLLDDYIEVADDPTLRFTKNTMTCWVKLPTQIHTLTYHCMFAKSSTGARGFRFYTHAVAAHRIYYLADSSIDARMAELLMAPYYNTWIHLAGTFDGARCRLFLNGELYKEATEDDTWTPDALPLWTMGGAANRFVDGLIDDNRIYNRVLSDKHIHYIATQELYPPP